MSTSPAEHYEKAEQLLREAAEEKADGGFSTNYYLRAAQVHATLATVKKE